MKKAESVKMPRMHYLSSMHMTDTDFRVGEIGAELGMGYILAFYIMFDI